MLGCKGFFPPQLKGLCHLENQYTVSRTTHFDTQVSPGAFWEMTNAKFASSDVYT